jgi:hypothetical protein
MTLAIIIAALWVASYVITELLFALYDLGKRQVWSFRHRRARENRRCAQELETVAVEHAAAEMVSAK